MNRNYLIGFAAAVAVLGLLAFAAWSFLEIYPSTSHVPPSREARANPYLALDRWLRGMGIPVRAENSGDLPLVSRAEERNIFIQASLFRWTDEAVKYLSDWVEEGGHLIVAYDFYELPINSHPSRYHRDDEGKSLLLLEEFGIKAEDNYESGYWSIESPDYDHNISFEVTENEGALSLQDWTGLTRLVEVERGKGKLTVMGYPRFLSYWYIGDAPNTRLAWALFAAGNESGSENDGSQNGWLFIRGTTRVRGLLGDLFRQGNFTVLLISILVLIITCFWTVIPVFGLVRASDEKPGKPLGERFLAEGRFLKRCDALGFYCMVYLKEIRRILGGHEGAEDEMTARLLEIWEGPSSGDRSAAAQSGKREKYNKDKFLIASFLRGEKLQNRNFPRMIEILTTIMERI